MIPFLFLAALLLLAGAGIRVAQKYGAVPAYIGFAWLIPLAGIIWVNYEYELDLGILNLPFIVFLTVSSFVLCILGLMLLVRNWRSLSALKIVGLLIGELLNGMPFLLFLALSIYGTR